MIIDLNTETYNFINRLCSERDCFISSLAYSIKYLSEDIDTIQYYYDLAISSAMVLNYVIMTVANEIGLSNQSLYFDFFDDKVYAK